MATMWWPAGDPAQEFTAPGAIYSGRGSSARVGSIVSSSRLAAPGATVLVAVDDSVRASGSLQGLFQGLEEEGFAISVVGGFGSEPDDRRLDAVAEEARRSRAELVVGVGGGSVLDAAKLISLLLRNEGRVADWIGAVDPPEGTASLVLVPTTSGTGSEANRHAIVTVAEAKRWSSYAGYVPRVVVLDAELLDSLPGPVVAATGLDALSHAVESSMSTTSTPMTVHHALRSIELLVANLERAVSGDPHAREACLWGSHFAGQALNAGVLLGHSLAYSLSHEVPLPHGVSSGFALPYCIAYNASHLSADARSALSLALTAGRSADPRDAAAAVQDLARRIGQPTTLDALGIPFGAEERMGVYCATEYARSNNPAPFQTDVLIALFGSMRTGDVLGAFDAVTPNDPVVRV